MQLMLLVGGREAQAQVVCAHSLAGLASLQFTELHSHGAAAARVSSNDSRRRSCWRWSVVGPPVFNLRLAPGKRAHFSCPGPRGPIAGRSCEGPGPAAGTGDRGPPGAQILALGPDKHRTGEVSCLLSGRPAKIAARGTRPSLKSGRGQAERGVWGWGWGWETDRDMMNLPLRNPPARPDFSSLDKLHTARTVTPAPAPQPLVASDAPLPLQ